MSSEQITKALEKAINKMFKPLVRILLRNGVSFGLFAEMAKRVYVEVATEEFQIPGKTQTTSRVATLTGLTRKDVQRLNTLPDDENGLNNARYNRAARVISAWTSEPEYLDDKGEPAALSIDRFNSLVRGASGDITPRTILDELVHVGAVQHQDNELKLLTRAYIPYGDDVEKIGILGTDVSDLIATIDHNIHCDRDNTYFQRKVCYDNLPDEVIDELREIIATKAQAALESINEDMKQRDRDSNPDVKGSGRVRAGLGIYYFQNTEERE